jgi:EmrB/QacA subfamily drug resistance transporter
MGAGMRDLGRPVLAAAAVVVCGAAMTILDSTIVNVAIERLAVAFDAKLATIQWVSTAYLLTLVAAIPVAGWAVDRFGTRRVFMAAVATFGASSLLCGVAWSAASLIAFRAVQGLGGGLVMPVGMTILARAAGPDRMGRVMALVGIPMLLAPAIGPALGGALLDAASWRAIFFVNLPVALLALVLAARVLPKETGGDARLDVRGLALLAPGLALIVAGFVRPVLAAAGAALIAAFVLHARRSDHPLIDVDIFKDRVVAASAATTFLFSAAFFGSLLLLALYFQVARDYSAFGTGLILGVQGAGAIVTMPVAGTLVDRLGAGSVVRPGVALVVLGTVPFVFADAPGWLLIAGLFIRGIGMGATLMPAMAAAYTVLAPEAVARAASALEIVQRTGALLGIALLAVVLQSQLPVSLSDLDDAPAALAAPVEAASAHTFVWALALTALALLPALALRSSVRPQADRPVLSAR